MIGSGRWTTCAVAMSCAPLLALCGQTPDTTKPYTLYGNIGSSFETQTTTELANSPSGAGGFNTGLRPQQAWNYEIGARGAAGSRFAYSVAVFQADVRDALIPYENRRAPLLL